MQEEGSSSFQAAITKYHNLGDLKQKLILSQFWKL